MGNFNPGLGGDFLFLDVISIVMKETELIKSILTENDFKLQAGAGFWSLEKSGTSKIKTYFISVVVGIALMIFAALSTLGESFLVVGLIIIIFPLISQRWKDPHKIIVEQGNSITMSSGITIARKVNLEDVLSLEVDESVLNSDVSPFKDGYQDFIYAFKLNTTDKSRYLFSLSFRKESASEVQEVFKYLSNILDLQKAKTE